MILRLTAAGVLDAERHFRKIAGYQTLPKPVASLRAHDAALDRQRRVDNRKQAAKVTIEPSLKINSQAGIALKKGQQALI